MQNQTDCKGSFSSSNIKRLAQTHSISQAYLWLIGAPPTPPIQPPNKIPWNCCSFTRKANSGTEHEEVLLQ